MKKVLAVILLLVYFTVSTGFVITLHYCMDRLASAGIGEKNKDTCDYCGMEKDGKCCRDDVKIVKLQSTHLLSPVAQPPFSTPAAIPLTTGFLLSPFHNFEQVVYTVIHGPPLNGQHTYLENCVFRI